MIILTWLFIIFIVIFGDYESKELEKDKKKWKEITGKEYWGE